MRANQHKLTMGTATDYIMIFIGIVILFQVVASLFPTVVSSGETLNSSGMPLGSLFVSGGAVWYLLAAGIIFLIFKSLAPKGK